MRSTFLVTQWGRVEAGDLDFILACPPIALALWHRLGRLPVDRALAGVIPRVPLVPRRASHEAVIRSVGSATELVLRKFLPTPARCTLLAGTRVALLRCSGVRAQYVSGVRAGETGLEFHAWVELGGCRLYEPAMASFQPLFRHPVIP